MQRARDASLERVDERHVVGGDVVVVLLDVAERLLVVPHQRVDLRVLAFLELVQFGLSTQVVLCLEGAQIRLVLGLDLARVTLVFFGQRRHQLRVRLPRDTQRAAAHHHHQSINQSNLFPNAKTVHTANM